MLAQAEVSISEILVMPVMLTLIGFTLWIFGTIGRKGGKPKIGLTIVGFLFFLLAAVDGFVTQLLPYLTDPFVQSEMYLRKLKLAVFMTVFGPILAAILCFIYEVADRRQPPTIDI